MIEIFKDKDGLDLKTLLKLKRVDQLVENLPDDLIDKHFHTYITVKEANRLANKWLEENTEVGYLDGDAVTNHGTNCVFEVGQIKDDTDTHTIQYFPPQPIKQEAEEVTCDHTLNRSEDKVVDSPWVHGGKMTVKVFVGNDYCPKCGKYLHSGQPLQEGGGDE